MTKVRKTKFDQHKAMESIIGIKPNENINDKSIPEETKINLPSEQPKPEQTKLSPKTIYLTDKQKKAIKLKVALSDNPEDKDESAVVRAALDNYLADIIETL